MPIRTVYRVYRDFPPNIHTLSSRYDRKRSSHPATTARTGRKSTTEHNTPRRSGHAEWTHGAMRYNAPGFLRMMGGGGAGAPSYKSDLATEKRWRYLLVEKTNHHRAFSCCCRQSPNDARTYNAGQITPVLPRSVVTSRQGVRCTTCAQ